MVSRQPTDASMDGPLPPGAWWIAASRGQRPKPAEPYGPRAGPAAIEAAKAGPLELKDVFFNYPLRPDMPGAQASSGLQTWRLLYKYVWRERKRKRTLGRQAEPPGDKAVCWPWQGRLCCLADTQACLLCSVNPTDLQGCRAVLEGVSLSLQRGTITALVGRSGAGKSTVASLLSRFYSPARGQVLLNGRPAESFTRGEWARAVALVSQETTLFEGALAYRLLKGLQWAVLDVQLKVCSPQHMQACSGSPLAATALAPVHAFQAQ